MIHRGLYGNDRFTFDIIFCDDTPEFKKFIDFKNHPTQEELKSLNSELFWWKKLEAAWVKLFIWIKTNGKNKLKFYNFHHPVLSKLSKNFFPISKNFPKLAVCALNKN